MKNMILGTVPTLDYACAESINTLATNITFSGTQYKSIMITSCVANEGKSYIAFHLARTLGNMGYRAVLVDADLRKSIFFSRYDVQITGSREGLTHYLAGLCFAEDALYQVNLPNLCVIPTGKEVINSLPLLTSNALPKLLENLKRSFDFIIVDAPPIGLLIDAAMIANSCDATVLVVTNDISKRELMDAVAQIQKSKCTILGAVLNKVTMETHKSRKYYYKSYYTHYGSAYEYNEENSEGAHKHKSASRSREKRSGSTTASGRIHTAGQAKSVAKPEIMTNAVTQPSDASTSPTDQGVRRVMRSQSTTSAKSPSEESVAYSSQLPLAAEIEQKNKRIGT